MVTYSLISFVMEIKYLGLPENFKLRSCFLKVTGTLLQRNTMQSSWLERKALQL